MQITISYEKQTKAAHAYIRLPWAKLDDRREHTTQSSHILLFM